MGWGGLLVYIDGDAYFFEVERERGEKEEAKRRGGGGRKKEGIRL